MLHFKPLLFTPQQEREPNFEALLDDDERIESLAKDNWGSLFKEGGEDSIWGGEEEEELEDDEDESELKIWTG